MSQRPSPRSSRPQRSPRPPRSLRPTVRAVVVAILMTTLVVLHVVLSPAAWHLGIDKADRPDRFTVAAAEPAPPSSADPAARSSADPALRSSLTPARHHPHHSLAAHACPSATVTTSHRTAGPAAGNPAVSLIPAVIPPAAPPAPAHEPATTHDDNSRPRAILPHLLRC